MRGINKILITGRILNKSIPIGADIALVSVMTRIFIINTIVARGEAGIKDSMAFVLLKLPDLAILPEPLLLVFVLPSLLVQAFMALEQPAMAFVLLKLPDLAILPEPLLLVFVLPSLLVQAFMALEQPALAFILLKLLDLAILPEPLLLVFVPLEQPALVLVNLRLVRAFVNLRQLLMMRKKSSSSPPTGARSQIVQPGRSEIILTAASRSPLFDQLNPLG
jgi:hypothetical protein